MNLFEYHIGDLKIERESIKKELREINNPSYTPTDREKELCEQYQYFNTLIYDFLNS